MKQPSYTEGIGGKDPTNVIIIPYHVAIHVKEQKWNSKTLAYIERRQKYNPDKRYCIEAVNEMLMFYFGTLICFWCRKNE